MKITCPGCGLTLESDIHTMDDKFNASSLALSVVERGCRGIYDELTAFTLTLGDKDFIHQLAVDTYAAQHIGPNTKPITTAFALIGLYLYFEKGYTGKQVQRAHMEIAKVRRQYPVLAPPKEKSWLPVRDVLPGLTKENYKARLDAWGRSVWGAWGTERGEVGRYLIEVK